MTLTALRQFQLVPYLVAVPQPPADGVADAQTVPVRHDLVVRDSQGRHGAAVRIPEMIAIVESVIAIADMKSRVRQCLGFCTADFLSLLAYETGEQKPKHCLT